MIIHAVSEAWGSDAAVVEQNARFYSDEKKYTAVIGKAQGKEIRMEVDILNRE
jgi:hypothetical protein